MVFKKEMNRKMPIKGFRSVYPLLTPSLAGKPFFGKMESGKPQLDHSFYHNAPYSFFKSSVFPWQAIPKQHVKTDLKNSKRIPNIYELSFDKLKPKIPFVGDINPVFNTNNNVKHLETMKQPLPKLDNTKIITIDIVKENKEPPAYIIEPVNDNGKKNVFNVPNVDITRKRDTPNGGPIDLTIIDIGNPPNNDKPIADNFNIVFDNINEVANMPKPDINSISEVPSFDVNGGMPGEISNKDMISGPIEKETDLFENLMPDTAGTIGDIPGFIVDGGIALDVKTEPVYDTNEIQGKTQGIDVLNINDVTIKGDNLGTSSDVNSNGLFDNVDIGIETGNAVLNGLRSNLIIGSNADHFSLDSNAQQGLQTFDVGGINNFSASNDLSVNIKPIGNGVSLKIANISGEHIQTTEEDVNIHGIGSVVVIRPVSFLMKVEPFGPGPYGQCRKPSRVICGARFGWEHVTGMVDWCKLNCVVYMYSSYCDDDRCQCKCV
jgi:hypothetical protein